MTKNALVGRVLASLIVAGLAAISTAHAARYWPRSFTGENGLGELCIEHPGANGRANIVPVTIVIRDQAELTLHGESAACYFMGTGAAVVSLRYSDPYGHWGEKPVTWTTRTHLFEVAKGAVTRVAICEAIRPRRQELVGWRGFWTLRPMGANETDPCSYLAPHDR